MLSSILTIINNSGERFDGIIDMGSSYLESIIIQNNEQSIKEYFNMFKAISSVVPYSLVPEYLNKQTDKDIKDMYISNKQLTIFYQNNLNFYKIGEYTNLFPKCTDARTKILMITPNIEWKVDVDWEKIVENFKTVLKSNNIKFAFYSSDTNEKLFNPLSEFSSQDEDVSK